MSLRNMPAYSGKYPNCCALCELPIRLSRAKIATMNNSVHQTDYTKQKRQDRLVQELEHDPYQASRKIKSPAVCPDCGAVYINGRWTWKGAATDAIEHVCPACRRIADRVPAAFLTLRGEFMHAHKDEILSLIQNYEAREQKEHPLKRIMEREESQDEIILSFSEAHLARGIGEALHKAYEGELHYDYSKGDIMLRVTWTR